MTNELQTRSIWKRNNLTFRDEHCGPADGYSLLQYVPMSVRLDPIVGAFWMDDFRTMLSTKAAQHGHWQVTEDDGAGGTDAVQEVANGVYRHYCDGDDEDEAYVHSFKETFKLQAGKHSWFEFKVKLTESATNKANFICGFAENVGAGQMQDAAAGPSASYDGINWFKRDSNMFLEFESSLAGAQVTEADYFAHVSAQTYHLGAWIYPLTSTTCSVIPWYRIGTSIGVLDTANAQALTITAHGEMEAFFGVKAGSTAEEYIEIDYVWWAAQR